MVGREQPVFMRRTLVLPRAANVNFDYDPYLANARDNLPRALQRISLFTLSCLPAKCQVVEVLGSKTCFGYGLRSQTLQMLGIHTLSGPGVPSGDPLVLWFHMGIAGSMGRQSTKSTQHIMESRKHFCGIHPDAARIWHTYVCIYIYIHIHMCIHI